MPSISKHNFGHAVPTEPLEADVSFSPASGQDDALAEGRSPLDVGLSDVEIRRRSTEVIGGDTAKGGTWAVAARFISRIMDLVTMVVLARVLRPADFGLVAIAMAVIFVVESALELPISQALVRLPEVHREHYDTAFTLSLIRAITVTLAISLLAWPFAHFYNDYRLLGLVCWLSLAPASRGFVSPKLADFSRRFDFTPDFTMELIGKFTAFSVSIIVALITHSYWSIALGTVISPLASTLTSYILAPYRPRLSLAALSSFTGFLGWITAAQMLGAINWQADRLLMGKLATRGEMGLFSAANDTANIPLLSLLGPVLRPLLSAFAHLRHDVPRLARSYQNSAAAIVTLALPILVGESILAGPTIRLLMGEHWSGAVVYLRWLPLSLIPSLFAAPLPSLAMAFDRTQIFFKRNLLEICVKLPLVIFCAIQFGFRGIVAARAISETVMVVYSVIVVRRFLGISITRQLLGPWRTLVSAAAMAAILAVLAGHININGARGSLKLMAQVLATVTAGTITYVTVLLSLWAANGKPAGLEAMLVERVLRRPIRATQTNVPEAL
jgi:O-antigen/teichoic acid export membrane protein